jgi:hypothetical protein
MLPDEALLGLPDNSAEELVLGGVSAQRITWHEAKEDGSHWFFVELWETKVRGCVVAAEGFALFRGTRRPLTPEELNEGP